MTAGLNGLNWHVHVDPLSLTIVTYPPTVFDVLDVFELLPQPATSVHPTANNMSHRERFIDSSVPSRRPPAGSRLRYPARGS